MDYAEYLVSIPSSWSGRLETTFLIHAHRLESKKKSGRGRVVFS